MELTLDTWITSDQHWAHRNIRAYCDRPDNHFEIMRRLWLERVQPEDTVLHLGDLVVYPKQEDIEYWIEGLTGKKYLLRGNHDKLNPRVYKEMGFTVLAPPAIRWQETVDHRGRHLRTPYLYWHSPQDGKRILFSHYPDRERLDWAVNIHGHIHNDPRAYQELPERDYRNVSVEVVDYAPQRLRDVLYGDAYAGRLGGRDTWREITPAREAQRRQKPAGARR
jgi:calcineurin-like phosphoesterase family protein